MASESDSNLRLEIGHVLFIDLVGYSKLLIEEQRERLRKLTEIVLATAQVRASTDEQLVRLPTGDGMALVFRNSSEEPAKCAVEIAQALKAHPEVRVRMGIHSGPVSEVTDVSGRSNIAGAGINMAQRVMDCGDAGHILLSKRVAEDLEQYRQWQASLHDLGECEVKHGVRLAVVNLYVDGIGNPAQPRKFQTAREQKRASPRAFLWAGVLLVAAALAAGAFWFFLRPARATTAAIPAKSIAVLPFDNLSGDPENAYFAEGVQDEILTRLAKVADLKVISRTSTQRFKSSPDDLRQIAQQLGVRHILEGSVQKSGGRVRVNVQLIHAPSDAHLWAETYDRQMTDIFAIESEIAQAIAGNLSARLSGSERQALTVRPTVNPEAYQLYLKGRYFWNKRTGPDLKTALDYFQQASTLDPTYAAAYAGLADTFLLIPLFSAGRPAEYFPRAKAAAQRALELDETLAEAHTAMAQLLCLYEFDFAGSMREFQRAIALNPNYATAHHWYGNSTLLSIGQMDQAVAEMKRALELDPLSLVINTDVGNTLAVARRYDEAAEALRRTIALDDNFAYAHWNMGLVLHFMGDKRGAAAELEKGLALGRDPFSLAFLGRTYAEMGEMEKARQIQRQLMEPNPGEYVPRTSLAILAIGFGDHRGAIDYLEEARTHDEANDLTWLRVDPVFDPLRGEPGFQKLLVELFARSSL